MSGLTEREIAMSGYAMRCVGTAASFLVFAGSPAIASDTTPHHLESGVVVIDATPSLDAHGHPHVSGEISNRSDKSWLAFHFTCRTDNTSTDGLPSYTFKLNVRYSKPLQPGEKRRFDVLPDASKDRDLLSHLLARYPQPYWWFCNVELATGDDTSHQTFTVGQTPPQFREDSVVPSAEKRP
jgi:hypothetical protein